MRSIGEILGKLPENNRLERIWKLAQIDFMKRYYNDRLGVVWALLNPLFQILVFYIVFSQILETSEKNYVLFLSCGILFWGVFAEISKGGMSVIKTKIYLIENIQFDKLDLFISYALSVFMAFIFNLSVYLVLALALKANINEYVFYILPILLIVFLFSIAISMILSILVLFYDDVKHLWDMLIFVGFWGSGVILNMESFTQKVPALIYINPFIPILNNGRNALLYGVPPDYGLLIYCLSFSLVLFGFALWLFRRCEHLVLEKL